VAKTTLNPLISIGVGNRVIVRLNTGRVVNVTITTSTMINPDRGFISLDSPLGKALLGRHKGETVDYVIGYKALKAEIIKVLAIQR
jgi:transcription elongation GreA/GreB family factor